MRTTYLEDDDVGEEDDKRLEVWVELLGALEGDEHDGGTVLVLAQPECAACKPESITT